MKLVKSLLLGTAAGIAAVAGAQAADLPAKKAAPVEYVRVCSTYGAGFFYIPGTEGCLRVGGQVRADYQYTERFTRAADAVGFYARGRVQLDHRQATAYGLLRTFVRMEIARGSGARAGGTLALSDSDVTIGPSISQAFIQFGGLTAGRVTSFFDNPDLPSFHLIGLRFSDNPETQLLAYTYSFGGGFSATISLEDPEERQSPYTFGGTAYSVVEGGTRIPDVVGNVRYVGTWGNVQLSGALTQIRDAGVVGGRTIGLAPTTVAQPYADSELGFAVMLNGGINLDAIAAGDRLWFAATYTDGALGYLGAGTGFGAVGSGAVGVGSTSAVINPLTGDIDTVQGWSLAGGFQHYWTPMLRSGIFGSYAHINAPAYASTFNTTTGTYTGLNDGNEYRIGANTIWSPVSGLNLGLEVMYTKVDPRGRVPVVYTGPAGATTAGAFSRGSDSFWQGRVRIERTF